MNLFGRLAGVGSFLALTMFAAGSQAALGQTNAYLDFKALSGGDGGVLKQLLGGKSFVKQRSIGKSLQGRDVWLVEIGNPQGMPLDQRPGILIVGNLEGDDLVGSANALGIIRYFLANADQPNVKKILDEQVIYVVPRLNPDGAEAYFEKLKSNRTRNSRPRDDDNDGRVDEDGPEDLNGDGVITVMRVKDPLGTHMIDPDNPRLLKKADPIKGEVGGYSVYWEGIDNDGDGFINEDAPGGVDLNRNFQHEYPYYTPDAGRHMVSESESRGLMDFTIKHRNIAAIMTFGHSDNLVTPPDAAGKLAPPTAITLFDLADQTMAKVFEVGMVRAQPSYYWEGGSGSGRDPNAGQKPAVVVNNADLPYFKAVSDAYRSTTGIRQLAAHRRPEGAFFQYGYFQFGVPSFSTPGWGFSDSTPPKPNVSAESRILTALEAQGVSAFAAWTAFQHPELGAVEIGGFRPYALTNPPEKELEALGRAHGAFIVKLASMLPRIAIADAKVKANGGGLYTVTVEVQNKGFFPTSLAHGQVARSVEPIMIQLGVPATDVIAGGGKTRRITKLDGSGARERLIWVIRGKPGSTVSIKVQAQKGGADSATVTLR